MKKEEENENRDGDHANGVDLALEISLGAFLDGAGDLTHSLVPGRQANDGLDQEKREEQTNDGADHRKNHTGVKNVEGEKGHNGSVESGGL